MTYFKEDIVVGFKFNFKGSIKIVKNLNNKPGAKFIVECKGHRFSYPFLLRYLNDNPGLVLTPKKDVYELY